MKSMNYHTESIFTGHPVYWCLKVYAEKKQALLVTRSCIVSSLHTLAGLLLWTIWKIKDDYIHVYIYILYIYVCILKQRCTSRLARVASRRKSVYSTHWLSLKLSKTNCKKNVQQRTIIYLCLYLYISISIYLSIYLYIYICIS